MSDPIRCRVAACPAGPLWDFYVINDSTQPFDAVILEAVEWEWGDRTLERQMPAVQAAAVLPGQGRLLWRGADEEVRMTLHVVVRQGAAVRPLEFAFPMLYRRRDRLTFISEVGADGWVERPLA